MDNLIHIKDFIYIEKRFLTHGDNLIIHNNLDKNTPYDIFINGEIYEKQASLQTDMPFTIPKDVFNLGYNEISIDNIHFGITKGYDETSNIISYNNCDIVDGLLFTQPGESNISISKGESVDMNRVLNINDIFSGMNIVSDISLDLLGNKESNKIYYGDILNNVESMHTPDGDISKCRYFMFELDIDDESELRGTKILDKEGNEYNPNSDMFSILDYNLDEYPVDSLLYSGNEEIVLPDSDRVFYEVNTAEPVYGFNIDYSNIKKIRILAKNSIIDPYHELLEINNYDGGHIHTNMATDYITSFTIDDIIYGIGSDGSAVEYDIIERPDLMPPISDDIISKYDNIDNITFHKYIDTIGLKDRDIKYGIVGVKDGMYLDKSGALDEKLYIHDISDINLDIFASDIEIQYYINTNLPMATKIPLDPIVDYYIKNKISISKFELDANSIHDEYVISSMSFENDYGIDMILDIFVNNTPIETTKISNKDIIQRSYNYELNEIKVGDNRFMSKAMDLLGYEVDTNEIILEFQNENPSIKIEVSNFMIKGTISDADKDRVSHTILMDGEEVSFNNKLRDVPYDFKFEWDNLKYKPGTTVPISIVAEDEFGSSSISSTSTRIRNKGIIITSSLGVPITNQFKEQIIPINLGDIISNNPPEDAFEFGIINNTGYDLKNIIVFRNLEGSIPQDVDIEFALFKEGESYKFYKNKLVIPSMKNGEDVIIKYNIDGINAKEGVVKANMYVGVTGEINR